MEEVTAQIELGSRTEEYRKSTDVYSISITVVICLLCLLLFRRLDRKVPDIKLMWNKILELLSNVHFEDLGIQKNTYKNLIQRHRF
jgi:hypothetical protein